MKIKYLGHSCFLLSDGEKSLLIDPYKDGSVNGLRPLRVIASKVICTHDHADHSGVECATILQPAEFDIQEIPSWHDNQGGALRGPNTMFVITMGGLRIAHLGDLGCVLNDEQRAKLANLDVLMIPVGGHFTINAFQAAGIVHELQPKLAIPMHYRGDDYGYDVLAKVDDFIRLSSNVENCGNEIDPAEHSGVVVMDFER